MKTKTTFPGYPVRVMNAEELEIHEATIDEKIAALEPLLVRSQFKRALGWAWEFVESLGRGIVGIFELIFGAIFCGFCFLIGAAFFALIYGAMALVIFAILKTAWLTVFGS